MSYGLLIENPSGKLIFSGERALPWCAGKGTHVSTGSVWASWGGFEFFSLGYTVPGSGARFACITLPTNGDSVRYRVAGTRIGPGATGVMIWVARPVGASYEVPEVYVCSTSVPTNGTWGLRLYDPSGSTLFDFSTAVVSYRDIMSHAPGTTGGQSIPNMPTKPAFLLPEYAYDSWAQNGPSSESSTGQSYATFYRRSGMTLYSYTMKYQELFEDSIINGSDTFGTNNAQATPFFDAANFD